MWLIGVKTETIHLQDIIQGHLLSDHRCIYSSLLVLLALIHTSIILVHFSNKCYAAIWIFQHTVWGFNLPVQTWLNYWGTVLWSYLITVVCSNWRDLPTGCTARRTMSITEQFCRYHSFLNSVETSWVYFAPTWVHTVCFFFYIFIHECFI